MAVLDYGGADDWANWNPFQYLDPQTLAALSQGQQPPRPGPSTQPPLQMSLTADHGTGPSDVMSPADMFGRIGVFNQNGQRLGPDNQPIAGPPPQPPYNPLAGGSANTGLPYQPPSGPGGIGSDARISLAGPTGRNAQAAGPIDPSIIARQKMRTPAATATAPPGGSPFTQFDRPNAPAAGRGGGGPMTMSMLDLSRLFQRARQNG